MYPINELKISKAENSHQEAVLAISDGVYLGLDYLPSLYLKWIRLEKEDPYQRRSLVLLDGCDKVVGYASYLIQDGGRLALQQGLRIDPALTGKGVGRRLMELCHQYLVDNFGHNVI